MINLVKTELRKEFNKSSERYWAGQLKQINHRDPTAFFPKINRLLRKKRLIAVEDQRIKATDLASLFGAIDVNKAIRIDEEYLINGPIDKLNVIGEFYQTIIAPRYLNTNTRLKEIVDEKAEKAKETLTSRRTEGCTFVAFSDENPALNPTANINNDRPFINPEQLNKILKKLPNKTSSGPDEIPSIILKHFPPRVTRALVIIFNNAINHSYFPKSWKSAKVLPILKKD